MRLSPNPIALGLVLFGAIAVIAGLFLPAFTCEDTDGGGWSYCEKDTGRLFQDDAFEDSENTAFALLANVAEITIIVLAVFSIFAALTRSGLAALSLGLLGFMVFEGFLLWNDIDQTNDFTNGIELAMGWAWIVLGGGVLLILAGAVVNLMPDSRGPSYPPSSYYGGPQPQQPPNYTPWS